MFKQLRTKIIGDQSETIAKHFLMQQGLKFVCANYHSRYGEIDLIFEEESTLVFVEVRYRKNNHFGHSVETINRTKQNKIIKTASYYLHQKKLTESVVCRFDVIGIEPSLIDDTKTIDPHSINWIKNAFSSV